MRTRESDENHHSKGDRADGSAREQTSVDDSRNFILETARLWVEMSSGAGGPYGRRRRRESSRNR